MAEPLVHLDAINRGAIICQIFDALIIRLSDRSVVAMESDRFQRNPTVPSPAAIDFASELRVSRLPADSSLPDDDCSFLRPDILWED